MVTHDPRYARHADRTVSLFDGRVVDEEIGSTGALRADEDHGSRGTA
jgi:putative ABC transport system ATP-binding protein